MTTLQRVRRTCQIEDVPNVLDCVITCDEITLTQNRTKKFALEVARFSMEKEVAPAEIGGEGAHGGFFRQ